MKKTTILILLIFLACIVKSQDVLRRDSIANTKDFQTKVRAAALKSSYGISNVSLGTNPIMLKYAQIWISNPIGGQIISMSYGVISNDAIDENSSQQAIQDQVNAIYSLQANAWFGVLPPIDSTGFINRN